MTVKEGEVIVTRADLLQLDLVPCRPMPMGLACCAIELMAAGGSRFDISRFGMEVMRFHQGRLITIVAGTVTYKMAEVVRRIYEKWEILSG